MAQTHHYLFDTATGFTDSTGGIDFSNSLGTINASGKINQAFRFEYIASSPTSTNGSNLLPTSGAFTIAFWMNENFGNYALTLFTIGDMVVSLEGKSQTLTIVKTGFGGFSVPKSAGSFAHYIISTNGSGTWTVYKNNVLQTISGTQFTPSATTYDSTTSFSFNGGSNGDPIFIDDLRIYDEIIDSTERSFIYNSGSGTQSDSGGGGGGSATQLSVITQPTRSYSSRNITTQPVINLLTSGGTVDGAATNTVFANVVSGNGTIGGSTSVSATSGVATFSGLLVTGFGPIGLGFTASGLTPTYANSFLIDIPVPIRPIRSETAGSIPTSGQLQIGELAINIADQKGFVKKTDGTIATVWQSLTSGSITSGSIGNAAVVSGSIASGSIGNFHLSSGCVTSGDIGNAAVVSGSIASGQVSLFAIGSGAVGSGRLGTNSVTSGAIGSGQVVFYTLGSGAVASGAIASGQVTFWALGSGAVTSGAIASGVIGMNHLGLEVENTLAKVNNFRLSVVSGLPVTSGNLIGQTTVHLVPYNGDSISLYDGSNWGLYTTSGTSVSLSVVSGTLASGKLYDIYCYNNAGVPALELSTVWTTQNARADAIQFVNGVPLKSGTLTRRFIGTLMTSQSGSGVDDCVPTRGLWNWDNRVTRYMNIVDNTLHTYNVTSGIAAAGGRIWRGVSGNIIIWTQGYAGLAGNISIFFGGSRTGNGTAIIATVTNTELSSFVNSYTDSVSTVYVTGAGQLNSVAGYNWAFPNQNINASGTLTGGNIRLSATIEG